HRFYSRCRDIRQINRGGFVLDGRNAHRGQMDSYCGTKSSPRLPARRRSIKKWLSHDLLLRSRARNALERFTLDFEGHLVKANRPQNVEHADDVEVNCVRIAANEHLGFRIFVDRK